MVRVSPRVGVGALFVLLVVACEPDPIKKIEVMSGSAGTSGAAGTSGGAGTTGVAGSVGSTGAAGDTGVAGDTGAAGDTGVAGTTGAAGVTAAAGTTGTAGTTAAAGTTGSAGTTGVAGSVGSTGAAGTAPPPPTCDTPAGACTRACWTLTPSLKCDTAQCAGIMASLKEARYAIDGNQATRYTTGRKQGGGPTDGGVGDGGAPPAEYVVLSFSRPVSITGFQMTSAGTDGPAAYAAQYSTDGATFQAFNPAVGGVGSNDVNVTFGATVMKALRIDQTGVKDKWWSIHELTTTGCVAQ
jgi:hypothetical protein